MHADYAGSDRYIVQRKIGAGGMGVVYEALDRERDAPIALKVLKSASARSISRFKNEFRALADVIHPNLVALYELTAEDEYFFFTMELVDGVHFLRYVRPSDETPALPPEPDHTLPTVDATVAGTPGSKRGSSSDGAESSDTGILDLRKLRLAMRQLAEGVAAIHEAGMLHRDLKPSNVLVTESGRLVVLDFGLVTAVADEDSQPEDRPLVGTATYMAPEQGARQPLTPASDWYAVGVMLYHALTGRPPFVGGQADVLLDKQQFEPPPPNEVAPAVPDDLNALCVELLRRDPERRPPGREVLRRLGSSATREHSTTTRSQGVAATLVGREFHRAVLDEAYATTRKNQPVLIYVRGDSGMGKTALVRSFLDDLSERAVVLRGRCYERESVPFKAVDSLVDALAGYLLRISALEAEGLMPRDAQALARVFPVLRQVDAFTATRRRAIDTPDPHVLRRLAFGALRELLTRIADRKPLILAIDDLQWGDVDSAGLLSSLLAPPDPPPVLVLGCCRSEDVAGSAFLEAFTGQIEKHGLDTRELDVGPLSPDEARQLALIHLSERRTALAQADRIAAESGGSPFFVEELARHVLSTGDSARAVSLDDALRARLNRLPEIAGRLLATIAVAGRPIPQRVVLRAADVSDPAALSLLKAGTFVRTRSSEGERFVESYHDRVRETVVAMLSDEAARERHLRLARTIEASPHPDPEALAIHYHGAGEADRAAEFAEAAARRAADSLAFDQAARLLRMAIDLTDSDDTIRRLQAALGDALANAGRGAEAATAYLAAVAASPSATEALELKRRAAEELLRSGHITAGLDLVDEILDGIGVKVARTPARAIASLLASRLRLALRGTRFRERDSTETSARRLRQIDTTYSVASGLGPVDAIRAAALGTKHLLMALNAGEPSRVIQGLAAEAVFVSVKGAGQLERTERIIEKMTELRDKLDTPMATAYVEGARGVACFQFGQWSESHDHTSRAQNLFRDQCTGLMYESATSTLFNCYSLAFMGRIPELNAQVDEAIAHANDRGDHFLDTSLRVSMRFYKHCGDDDPDAAIAEIDTALENWSTGRFDLQVWAALLAYFSVDGYAGEPERGIERHRRHWGPLKRSQLWSSQVMRTHHSAFLARLFLRAGARNADSGYIKRAARYARALDREKVAYAHGFAALLRAGIARHAGADDDALAQLRAAEARFVETNMGLNEATCKVLRGQLVGGDEGAALVADGTRFIDGAGLPNTNAILLAIAPGFPE